MKRLISLILIISLTTLISVGCVRPLDFKARTYRSTVYSMGSAFFGLSAKIRFFDTSDVTLDMELGLFNREEGKTLDELKAEYIKKINEHFQYQKVDSFFVIYASKGIHVAWPENAKRTYQNSINAAILKIITLDEAFEQDYSYTSSAKYGESGTLSYNKTLKITIPEELFDTEYKMLSIWLYRFDVYYKGGEYTEYPERLGQRIDIRYVVHDKTLVELIRG